MTRLEFPFLLLLLVVPLLFAVQAPRLSSDRTARRYAIAIAAGMFLVSSALAFFYFTKPPRHHGPIDKFLISEIGFDEKQTEAFQKLKEEHHSAVMEITQKEKPLRDAFENLLKSDQPDTNAADSIAKQMANSMYEIHMITFRHFADVRKLCRDDQKPKFDRIIGDILRRMGAKPTPPPGGHPPGGQPPR